MCWYITIATKTSDRELVRNVALSYSLQSLDTADESAAAQLFGPETNSFFVTHGGCSCDLFFSDESPQPPSTASRREKLKRKGWSESKIDRAMAESESGIARNRAARGASRKAAVETLREFVSSLASLCGVVHIYCHLYKGAISDEVLPPPTRLTWGLNEFIGRGLVEDAIVTVRAAG